MAEITFKGQLVRTYGDLPEKGQKAPSLELVTPDLALVKLETFGKKKKILNIFISLDTGVCAKSVHTFYESLKNKDNVSVLNISMDLPFAAGRFCKAESLGNVHTLSAFRSTFPMDYGVLMMTGPLAGLCARAIVVLDEINQVIHSELVPEISQEPNYKAAIAVL